MATAADSTRVPDAQGPNARMNLIDWALLRFTAIESMMAAIREMPDGNEQHVFVLAYEAESIAVVLRTTFNDHYGLLLGKAAQ